MESQRLWQVKTHVDGTTLLLRGIQWMEFVNQTDDRFVDRTGVRQRIKHAWNTEEVKVDKYPVENSKFLLKSNPMFMLASEHL